MAGFDWGDIIGAALAIYGQNRAGQKPNFYEVPQTEDEKWANAKKKELYDYSPTRDYISSMGQQMMQQNSSAQAPSFISPLMKQGGQTFGGGQLRPGIDFSKLPQAPWAVNRPGATTTPTQNQLPPANPLPDTGNANGLPQSQRPFGAGGRMDTGAPANNIGNESGALPFGHGGGMGQQYDPAKGAENWKALGDWWGKWRSANPNATWQIAATAAGAAFGPLGVAGTRILQYFFQNDKGGGKQSTPGDGGTNNPGTSPSNPYRP